jgi:SAM-dependent methyltransferase
VERVKILSQIMEQTSAYRLWQAPFREQKLVPLRNHNDFGNVRSVLDLGCGPGTNTSHFRHADYVGLDVNERYIDYARRRYGRKFVVIDICSYAPPPESSFDFILVNSFFHHIDDYNTLNILSKLKTLLTPDGHIHVLDLVLPEKSSIARMLARCDRGDFPRPLERWQSLFDQSFKSVILEPYSLTAFGITLWNMVYFKGKAK